MKRVLLFASAFSLFAMVSCIKDKPSETAGDIPGMGNNTEALQVKAPYELPEEMEFVEIVGLDATTDVAEAAPELKSVNSVTNLYGSGCKQVRVAITIINKSEKYKTVYFPKGLIWQCANQGTQHGILVQATWFCFNPHSTRTIWLDLYCLNYGFHGSSPQSYYGCIGVTNSEVMWKLLNLFGTKKINYEHWYGCAELKSTQEGVEYEQITEEVQDMVWNLTNHGVEITAEQKAFVDAIPELEPGSYPESLFETPSEIPSEYFEEYDDVVLAE